MLALTLVGSGVTVIVGFVVVVLFISWFSNPPFALGDAPAQPVAFPHDVHVAEQGIQCEFCHRNVTKGEAATVPAVEQCLFCHKDITVGTTEAEREEIGIVVSSFADGAPINWERVHRLPDHVRFVHEAHVRYLTEIDGSDRTSEEKGTGGLLDMPRRRRQRHRGPAQALPVDEDGHLPGLPPVPDPGP